MAFNRADSLERSIKSILSQKHGRIYVSCDGPRISAPNETQAVLHLILSYQAQGIIQAANFLETNLGTLDGIHAGIDWFFENESEGLIIEDDIILHAPVLDEAERLFNVFRKDLTVGSISLRNWVDPKYISDPHATYRRSQLTNSAAWGTSRTNWQNGYRSIATILENLSIEKMQRDFGSFRAKGWRTEMIVELEQEVRDRSKANWDIRWTSTHLVKNWTCLVFNHNRVEYIGYGSDATHTKTLPAAKSWELRVDTSDKPWIEPVINSNDNKADRHVLRRYGIIGQIRTRVRLRTRARNISSKIHFVWRTGRIVGLDCR